MEEIVFDTNSGISLEEQKEILAGINAMAVGSRIVPETVVTVAKRKGYFFPLIVNIAAFAILALGAVLLSFFHSSNEQQIRESSAVLGLTERMLVHEIRQETNRLMIEKENEINNILTMLSAAAAEYRTLHESVETLTEEQSERAAYLLLLQEEYQKNLLALYDERSRILEDARINEATLRAQAEERARELTIRIEEGQVTLSEAMEELRRLGSEQDRFNRAESQMDGFYATANSQISDGRLTEASFTLAAMRDFLDAPSLQTIRAFETRKQTHLTVIEFMESAIAASQGAVLAGAQDQLAALMARNAALEQKSADLEQDIAAISSQGSDQARIIADYSATVRQLENARDNQQTAHRNELAQRTRELEAQRNETAQRTRELETQRNETAQRARELEAQRNETAQRTRELETQRNETAQRVREMETLRTEMERRVSELSGNITSVRAENEAIQRQNAELQRQIEAIRALLQD